MPKLTPEQLDAAADAWHARIDRLVDDRRANEQELAELEFCRAKEVDRVRSLPRQVRRRTPAGARLRHGRGSLIRAYSGSRASFQEAGSRARLSACGPSGPIRGGDRQQVGSLVEHVADVALDPVPANLLVV